MFGGIARRYDLANRVLSFGIDHYWRWRLVRLARAAHPRTVLDLATGSGDVAFALRRRLSRETTIQALDFCEPMLEQARLKQVRLPEHCQPPALTFENGDCLKLPVPDNSVDVITIAFGFRNLEDRAAGLAEMRRVLRPGGTLLVLEFTQPYRWFRPLYRFHLRYCLPRLAGLLTGRPEAYQYLAGTINSFPTVNGLSQQIIAGGFESVRAIPLTLSIVAIHRATNPEAAPAQVGD